MSFYILLMNIYLIASEPYSSPIYFIKLTNTLKNFYFLIKWLWALSSSNSVKYSIISST